MKEIFLSRARSLLEVLSSRNSGDEESLEHDCDDLHNVVDLLTEKRDSLQSTRFYAQAEQRASPGRPKLITTESQISYLSDYGFKAVDMAF